MAFYVGKYKDIIKKDYEFEVITPMFLGASNPKEAELRIPSIKGMLRFWWRATCGISSISDVKKKEDEIFGSTERKSDLSINLLDLNIKISKELFKGDSFIAKGHPLDILHYLAYGAVVYDRNIGGNKVDKEYINVNSNFKLNLSASNNNFEDVERALRYLIFFGNIGAKSRNGFGSLYSKDVGLINSINFENDYFDFTSFSKHTKLIKFKEEDYWEDALSSIGMAYKDARLSLEDKHTFEKRALIAKPIEVKGEIIPDYIRNKRHSKPYFLKVNKLNNGKFQGQILCLPYNYHERNQRNEYFKVLEKMNQKIEELSGGSKWQ